MSLARSQIAMELTVLVSLFPFHLQIQYKNVITLTRNCQPNMQKNWSIIETLVSLKSESFHNFTDDLNSIHQKLETYKTSMSSITTKY